MVEAITKIEIAGIQPSHSGKVRDIFDLGDKYLLVATDRISAFDCILPQGIPEKGKILTQLSNYWFGAIPEAAPNHLISTEVKDFPEPFNQYADLLGGRSMLVKKAEPILIECVVRGYLAGSGWAEYQKDQTVCGVYLEKGLELSSKLSKPIYTPAKKNHEGHDENISYEETVVLIGGWESEELRERSLEIYKSAAEIADKRGLILADTKFEFGFIDGEITLIDELLTPDSSRFWSKDDYSPGKSQDPFDKQYVRDYLNGLDWDKTPPAPNLPDDVIDNTRRRYIKAYELITGREWDSHS